MRGFAIDLFDRWTAMWNGDLALAEEIMAPEFTLRYAQPGAVEYDDIHDRAAFIKQIEVFRAERPGLEFEVQGLPVVEMDDTRTGLIARPYGARITRPDGTAVALSGNDILRTENGQIVEVWSVSGGQGGRSFY
ncbi:nuclear transport factor 2 family protein [Nocardia sp. NPDC056000]|uniref:nuclear transport factor 2 family protein n=1 Tax=Nocardia sp. NPDC056000 TaxID=3345674 RepID=UPI0035DAAE8B